VVAVSLRPLRLLHVIPNLNLGGAELQVLMLCEGLRAPPSRFDIRVLTLFEKGALERTFAEKAIAVECLDIDSDAKSLRTTLMGLWRMFRFLRSFRPHIVHTHLWAAERYCLPLALFAGVKARFTTLHGCEPSRTLRERFYNFLAASIATRIVAVSASAADFWAAKGYPKSKMAVIYNAPPSTIAGAKPRTAPVDNAVVRVIAVGRLEQPKGHLYLIRAAARLVESGVRLVVDIWGPAYSGYVEVLKREIEASNLNDTVFLRGATDNPSALMQRYDILAAPSLWEGMSLAPVEAMAAGLPVVASDIPAHREILCNGTCGLLAAPADAGALAAAIRRLRSDTGLYCALSRAGIERARDFDAPAMVARYRSMYESELLPKRKSTA